MTDPTTTAAQDKSLVIVPTLQGWLELAERVEALEAAAPATVPDDVEPLTLQSLSDRLDRHRGELEDIKGRWNQMIRYLRLQTGPTPTSAAAAAETPESYQ